MKRHFLDDAKAKITDKTGESMYVLYNQETKEVYLQIESEGF